MIIPQYDGNSSVNLASSIKGFCGVKDIRYPELKCLTSETLQNYKNVIFFLLDWIWAEWLKTYWKDSFLHQNMKSEITSIFPSTTSSAVTTFNTWLTPSEHAIMWWNMYSKEVWSIIQILPWKHKLLKISLWDRLKIEDVVTEKPFYPDSQKEAIIVLHEKNTLWEYNSYYTSWASKLCYTDIEWMFKNSRLALDIDKNKRYIFSYWSNFDWLSHDFWVWSKEVMDEFRRIDEWMKDFAEKVKWLDTLIIVSSDHWQIDIQEKNKIDMRSTHPDLCDMLVMPMAWESRVQYCFVKPGKEKPFEEYVKTNLSEILDIFSKEEALKIWLFWFWDNKKFKERIGDYILIPKDGYAIFDEPIWDRVKADIWFHWWMSRQEIMTPLIIIWEK